VKVRGVLTAIFAVLTISALIAVPLSGGGVDGEETEDPIWAMSGNDPGNMGLSSFSIDGNGGIVEKKIGYYSLTGTPIISDDGNIHVSSKSNAVYCFDPSGEVLWKFQIMTAVMGSPALSSDGTLYIATYSSGYSADYLYSIDVDGQLNWISPLGGGGSWLGPVLTEDGTIHVCTQQGDLRTFNEEGDLLWSYHADDEIWSSPAVDDNGSVYFSCHDGNIYSISREGELRWKFPVGGQQWASPSVGHDGTVFFGSHSGVVYAINPDGTERWSYVTNKKIMQGVGIGPDDSVYVQSGDRLLRIGSDGILMWWVLSPIDEEHFWCSQKPTVDSEGNVLVGMVRMEDWERRYYLEAYDESGAPLWSVRLTEYISSSDTFFPASITDEGEVLVVIKGYLHIIDDPYESLFLQLAAEGIILVIGAAALLMAWRYRGGGK